MDHASPSPCFSLQHFKTSKPISSLSKDNLIKFRSTYSPRGNVVARAFQEDEYAMQKPHDSHKSRDKLIALLKHIQFSISQEESGSSDDKSCLLSDDDSFAQTSILEFLQSSIENVNSNSQGNEHSIQRTKSDEQNSVFTSPVSTNAKGKRVPSNFVKKSPIPSPPMPSSNNVFELNDGGVSSSNANNEPELLKEMKLSDLKGLAKERGVRGYSKLKKSELIELLRCRDQL